MISIRDEIRSESRADKIRRLLFLHSISVSEEKKWVGVTVRDEGEISFNE